MTSLAARLASRLVIVHAERPALDVVPQLFETLRQLLHLGRARSDGTDAACRVEDGSDPLLDDAKDVFGGDVL